MKRLLPFLLLLVATLAQAADIVDVHKMREDLWQKVKPETTAKLQEAKALARAAEERSREKVIDELVKHMTSNDLPPPVHSGTPPSTAGASGVLTDVDQTYKSKAELDAAKRWFRERGYTVVDKLPNGATIEDAFMVKELDYTGFTGEKPNYRPNSAAAERFSRVNARFSEATATVGGQEWVESVKAEAEIGALKKEADGLAQRVARGELTQAEAAKRGAEIAKRTETLDTFMRKNTLSDQTGYVADMVKKTSHHMDPAHWCPPQMGFRCWEEPRQAAKAAERIIKNIPENLRTPEQAKRLELLTKISKSTDMLPADETAFRVASEEMRDAIRQTFREGFEFAAGADNKLAQSLRAELKAARAAGDANKAAQLVQKLETQREAASRIALTLDGVRSEPGGMELLHELMTGEKLERTVSATGEVRYQVLETFARADGSLGTRTRLLTPDQVRKTGSELIKRKVVEGWVGPGGTALPGEAPRFSSFSEEAKVRQSSLRKLGAVGWGMIGVTAVMAAKEATEMSAHDQRRVPTWGQIASGKLSAEEIKGWAYTTAVGTALTVGHLTGATLAWDSYKQASKIAPGEEPPSKLYVAVKTLGVFACQITLVCPGAELAGTAYAEAEQEEQRRAALEGREPSKLGAMKILLDRAVGAVDVQGAALDAAKAFVEQKRAEWENAALSGQLKEWFANGGLEKLMSRMQALRGYTDAIKALWEAGADAINRAVFASEGMTTAMAGVDRLEAPDKRCAKLIADMGPNPTAEARKHANEWWQAYLADRKSVLEQGLRASYELYGAASEAKAALGDGLNLAKLLDRQEQLRQNMRRSINALALNLPNDGQLAALGMEVDGMREPIPVGNAEESLKAAVEYLDQASKTIDRLVALIKQDASCAALTGKAPDATADTTPPPQAGAVARSIAIVLDASGSMAGKRMEQAKRSAAAVLSQLSADTEVALIVFAGCGRITIAHPFTTDAASVAAVLPGIRTGGGTPLAAATVFAKKYIGEKARGASARLVLLTDGKESCGGDPIRAARSGGS